MSRCRSWSPRARKECLRRSSLCKPSCCKPCCVPRRRCRSVSPGYSCSHLSISRYCDPCSPCSPCSDCNLGTPCEPYCSPRRRRPYRRRRFSPYSPYRRRYFTSPCYPSRLDPSCSPLKCDFTSRYYPYCDPCSPRKPRSWRLRSCSPCKDGPCDSCNPLCASYCASTRCVPCDHYDPCYSRPLSPCSPKKCSPCYPRVCSPCEPCCSPTHMTCCEKTCRKPWRSRRCSPCSPRLCGTECCSPRRSFFCRPRRSSSCDVCPVEERVVKSGRIQCDQFSKVCYPRVLPFRRYTSRYGRNFCKNSTYDPYCCTEKSSCADTPLCSVAKIGSPCFSSKHGPSREFLQKSRKVGRCYGRFDPHHCPWEADISVSGTVRGHCSSTAVEVARKMAGRFKAQGERYTRDSAAKKPCPGEPQNLSLGRLDDGSMLNFSRNCESSGIEEVCDATMNCCPTKEADESLDDGYDSNAFDDIKARHHETMSAERDPSPRRQLANTDLINADKVLDSSLKKEHFVDRSPTDHTLTRYSEVDQNRSDRNISLNRRLRHRNHIRTSDYGSGTEMKSRDPSPRMEVKNFLNVRKLRRHAHKASQFSREPSKETLYGSLSGLNNCYADRNRHSLHGTSSIYTTAPETSPMFTPPSHMARMEDEMSSETNPDDLHQYEQGHGSRYCRREYHRSGASRTSDCSDIDGTSRLDGFEDHGLPPHDVVASHRSPECHHHRSPESHSRRRCRERKERSRKHVTYDDY